MPFGRILGAGGRHGHSPRLHECGLVWRRRSCGSAIIRPVPPPKRGALGAPRATSIKIAGCSPLLDLDRQVPGLQEGQREDVACCDS